MLTPNCGQSWNAVSLTKRGGMLEMPTVFLVYTILNYQ